MSGPVIRNGVRPRLYLDSVALMRISRDIARLDGVEDAGLMMGTPANREIMREARVLAPEGDGAGPGDLVIGVRARTAAAADAALAQANAAIAALTTRKADAGTTGAWQPRTLRAAAGLMPDANLALISVPGDFAAAEARKALRRGLNVMMFSDNVPIEQEIEIKREARELGLLVMGPDCGTAIIGGVPLAFANVVPRGDIGIVGASGTGIQEISCLIARAGRGISHAIGTGGRDLKAEVGGITTLMAIEMLDADPATRQVVIVSKPPADAVARSVLSRVAKSRKRFVICFLGGVPAQMPDNAEAVTTLEAAAAAAIGSTLAPLAATAPRAPGRARLIRGLYSGGTLCAEAQVLLRQAGRNVVSNVPIPGVAKAGATAPGGPAAGSPAVGPAADTVIDLGDDEFTRGRPHPMIEPAVRDMPLQQALRDRDVAVVLLDCVLGFGGHADPAGHLAAMLRGRPQDGPAIIASVTGTEGDPQCYSSQAERLLSAGIAVEPSNAAAVRLALRALGK